MGLAIKLGLSSNNLDELQQSEYARFIGQMFGDLEVSEIPKACDLACAGKLGMKLNEYSRLSNTLIGTMLESYRRYKHVNIKKVAEPQKIEKVSEKAKEIVMREAIEVEYNCRKRKSPMLGPDHMYAKLFEWLDRNTEIDIRWNYTEIEQRNRLEIKSKTKINKPEDKRILEAWIKGDNDTHDVRLNIMTKADLFIQYLDKCLEKDVKWDKYLA